PILPDLVRRALEQTLPDFARKLGVRDFTDVCVYGAETRSSSPVQIIRDDQGCSVSTPGFYPAGEGAGYAGGIVSSAVDGIQAARCVIAVLQRSFSHPVQP
ncbi:MAG: FAD-dependent oxidoreductase, partial [Fibrobacterota bacterium]